MPEGSTVSHAHLPRLIRLMPSLIMGLLIVILKNYLSFSFSCTSLKQIRVYIFSNGN